MGFRVEESSYIVINRLTLSYPTIRTYIRQQVVKIIEETYAKPDVIAGVATGGIALGALVAQELGSAFLLYTFRDERSRNAEPNRRSVK